MSERTSLDAALGELGAELGIEGLAFDQAGLCRLGVDDLVLDLERDGTGSRLFLSSLVGELPATGREAAMARLLDANCYFKGTQGGTLGVAAGTDSVVLAYQAPAGGLGFPELRRTLENFVAAAEHARGLLEAGQAEAAPAAMDMSAPFMIRG